MPWQARFPELTFGLPLIDNLLAIIARDQTEALAFVHKSAMPVFERVLKAERISKVYPYVALFPRQLLLPLGEDAEPTLQSKEIMWEIVNIGSDPEALKQDVEERVVALHHIVTSASEADIYEGISVRPQVGLTINETVYEEIRDVDTAKGRYLQLAWGSYVFQYVEDLTL